MGFVVQNYLIRRNDVYKHFSGGLYIVDGCTRNLSKVVCYEVSSGKWRRFLFRNFCGMVDCKKYPNTTQECRFELQKNIDLNKYNLWEYKAIFSRLEKTILHDDGELSERTIKAIQQLRECGIAFHIATDYTYEEVLGMGLDLSLFNTITFFKEKLFYLPSVDTMSRLDTSCGQDKKALLGKSLLFWGCPVYRFIFFGCEPEDFPYYRYGGLNVSVANAAFDAQILTQCITASNNEDGVAKFLEWMLEAKPSDWLSLYYPDKLSFNKRLPSGIRKALG